jgi:acyl dehydratase
MLLHGEEKLILEAPLEAESTYICQDRVIDLQDKGKGTVVITETTINNKDTGIVCARV